MSEYPEDIVLEARNACRKMSAFSAPDEVAAFIAAKWEIIAEAILSERNQNQWQDIATAPKDGTDILVCVTYNLSADEFETKVWVDWQTPAERWPVYWGRIDVPFQPTHWMPLPAPPIPHNPTEG